MLDFAVGCYILNPVIYECYSEKSVDTCWINVSATVGIMFFYSSSMWIDGVFFGG